VRAAGPLIGVVPTPEPAPISDAYRRYVLGLLLLVYIFNFIDRQILTILAEAIRLDLGLSDTALGFLGGFAFAFFYTLAGIPIARWADRGVRRSIIALGLFAWSAMTALTGFARSFTQLALARVGVGLGEAACSPPAHSLLSDYFPPERRGTAFAVYALGIPIGGAIGTVAGGWIKELFDWRTAFFLVGLPGIALFGGGLGTFLGGWLGDRFARRDQRWYMWVPGTATAIGIPFAAGVYLWPDGYVALLFAVPASLLGAMWLGPTFAMAQGLASADMRALVSAMLLFVINLVGLGLGPLVVGVLSDVLKADFGAESVRYALLWVVLVGAAWSTLHYALAARTLRGDLRAKHG
jgi:MFS family permease